MERHQEKVVDAQKEQSSAQPSGMLCYVNINHILCGVTFT